MDLFLDDKGLIPAIAQDYVTKEVLMLAYMNEEALNKTIETGNVHYYSRSRKALWQKGETSGHFQCVREVKYDCDGDCILLLVEQTGAACHTGEKSCFFRSINKHDSISFNIKGAEQKDALKYVSGVIKHRKDNPKEGSYTNYLFDKGVDKMLKKVGEENAEVIIAVKNQNKREITSEIADLMYHLSVAMAYSGVEWDDIYNELESRRH